MGVEAAAAALGGRLTLLRADGVRVAPGRNGVGAVVRDLGVPGTLNSLPSSSSLTWLGLTNMPCPALHEKYASPATEPSFLPFGASSSMPVHLP